VLLKDFWHLMLKMEVGGGLNQRIDNSDREKWSLDELDGSWKVMVSTENKVIKNSTSILPWYRVFTFRIW
jgi:hypothetical protein